MSKEESVKEYISGKETFRISTRIAIFDERNNILILQCAKPKKRDGWDFPGGHVDKNEQVEEAAIREVKEETGLDIQELTLLDTKIQENKNKCLVYYSAYTKKTDLQLSREHKDFKWLPVDQLVNYDLFYESSLPIAKRAFELINKK